MKTIGKCHQNGVYHQDIKHANVLINTQTFETKLIDFGSARMVKVRRNKLLNFNDDFKYFLKQMIEVVIDKISQK